MACDASMARPGSQASVASGRKDGPPAGLAAAGGDRTGKKTGARSATWSGDTGAQEAGVAGDRGSIRRGNKKNWTINN